MRLPRRAVAAPFLASVIGLTVSWPARAPAEDGSATQEILVSLDGDSLLEIMQSEGYTADIDDRGVIIWKIEGYKTQLFIDKETGSNTQFHVSFANCNATLERVNAWNRTKRYSRTYLDDEGDPHLELDLDLEGGVTRERVADFLKTCRVSMGAWCREVVE